MMLMLKVHSHRGEMLAVAILMTILLVSLLCIPVVVLGQPSPPPPPPLPVHTIDGCATVHSQGGTVVTIQAVSDSSQQADESATIIKILFVNCHITAENMNIKIAIPSFGGPSHGNAVEIHLINMTMRESGGSFAILPSTTAPRTPPPSSFSGGYLDNVRIIVENTVIDTSGSVLVVDGTGATGVDVAAQNVVMQVRNSVLRSANSDVALVKVKGKMVGVYIGVGGNTTLQGASIATLIAAEVVNSSLLADSSACHGPIQVESLTSASTSAFFSILSSKVAGTVLRLSNVSIAVTDSSSTTPCHNGDELARISMVAEAIKAASVAGIMLQDTASVALHLTGFITIDMRLSRSRKHSFVASSSSTTSPGSSTAVVGGIVLLAYGTSDSSRSALSLNRCDLKLALSIESQYGSERGEIVLKAKVVFMASTVFGIVVNGYVWSKTAVATTTLTQQSTIAIVSSFTVAAATRSHLDNLSTVLIEAHVKGGVCSTLGIASSTFSNREAAITSFRIADGSMVNITSVSSPVDTDVLKPTEQQQPQPPVHVSLQSTAKGASSASTLGIALNGFARFAPTGNANFVVDADCGVNVLGLLSALVRSDWASAASSLGIVVMAEQSSTPVGGNLRIAMKGTMNIGTLVNHSTSVEASGVTAAALGLGIFSDDVLSWTLPADSGIRPLRAWVGAIQHSSITTHSSPFSTAVGIFQRPSTTSLDASSVAYAFCSDGTVTPVSVGAALKIDKVPVSTTTSWDPSSPDDSCTASANQLKEAVHHNIKAAFEGHPSGSWSWYIGDGSSLRTPTGTFSNSRSLTVGSPTESTTLSSSPSLAPSSSATPSLIPDRTPTWSASPSTSPTPTASRTLSASPLQSPPNSAQPPPSPPPLLKRKVTILGSTMLADNPTAATVVVSSAGASSMVASTLGSGGAGVVVIAGSALRVMECGLAEDDPRPAAFELPIQFAVGNSTVRYIVGAVLAHTAVDYVLLAAPVFLRRREMARDLYRTEPSKLIEYMALVFCGTHSYFVATVLGGCVTVMVHSGGDTLSVAVGGGCMLAMVGLQMVVCAAVHQAPARGLRTKAVGDVSGRKVKLDFVVDHFRGAKNSNIGKSSTDVKADGEQGARLALLFSAESTKDLLLTLFDGCRVFEQATHRHYGLIESSLASVVAMIAGARPDTHCNAAAFAIGALALLGLGYVVVVRPFRALLDTCFSILNNGLLVLLAGCVAVTLQSEGNEPPSTAVSVMQFCLWGISCVAIVQLVVQGYWAHHVAERRRHQEEQDTVQDALGGGGGTEMMSQRLLTINSKTSHDSDVSSLSDSDGSDGDDSVVSTADSSSTDGDDDIRGAANNPLAQ